MDLAEIVIHEMQADGVHVIFYLFRERIGSPGEPADTHPPGQVLAFDVTGADVVQVRISCYGLGFAPYTRCRTVSLVSVRLRPVQLD